MNTEIADKQERFDGRVCYDRDCPVCRKWAGRFAGVLQRNGFAVVPLQAPEIRAYLRLPETNLLQEMRVISADGKVIGGADAVIFLSENIQALRPLYWLAKLPGVRTLLRGAYRWLARNRACDAAVCQLPSAKKVRRRWFGAFPLLVLTGVAVYLGRILPGWAWMWTICFALFLGCKWLVLIEALRIHPNASWSRRCGFFFGWIGMDVGEFFNRDAKPAKTTGGEWLFATGKMLLGAALVWGIARNAVAIDPLLGGWTGMTGLILLLHFGFFELLAFVWRVAGINVTPLMVAPIQARSLAEFWGRRWNTGFHRLTEEYVFHPMRRRIGARPSLLFAFLLSGLLHDLVISVPARGGYGLSTIYFLIQGAGVLFERTAFARRWGMGRGGRGWLFTMLVTAGPAFWLFHPPFVRNTMIPFLQTLNAL